MARTALNRSLAKSILIGLGIWIVFMLSIITAFYPGGLRCFLFPGGCRSQYTPEPLALMPTVIPSPRATLRPTPTQWSTPTPSPTVIHEELQVHLNRSEPGEVSCDADPYTFNYVAHGWERNFIYWCYEVNGDPFEAIFGGYNDSDGLHYGEVQWTIFFLGLQGTSREQQLAALSRLGLWSLDCSCVPDGAPELNEVLFSLLEEDIGET